MLVGRDERQRLKNRVAQTFRLALHGVADRGVADLSAVVRNDVRLPRRDDETDARGAAGQHAVNQIFADGARPLGLAIEAAADRQQLFAERERLNAAADSSRGNDAPHHEPPNIDSSCSARRPAL